MTSNRHFAAQLICGALENRHLTSRETVFFRDHPPAGLTLFSRNIEEAELSGLRNQIQIIQSLKTGQELPFIIAIDQEGGRVRRLKSAPDIGAPFAFEDQKTDKKTLEQIKKYGRDLGKYLDQLEINVNFAPVADLWTEASNTSIGDRCFGNSVESVFLRAGSFLDGLKDAQILGCLKHFPGQGAGKADTHLGSTEIDVDEQTLFGREIEAFKLLLSKVEMVMISHAIFKNLDPRPASLSAVIMEKILRKKLNFPGVIVSDDMNMKAIDQDEQIWSEVLIESLMAGTDLFLICRDIERCFLAVDVLEKAQRRSNAAASKVYESVTRVRNLRAKILRPT